MSIFSGTMSNLERGLNFSAMKHKVIAQNIANVDTPNYKAKSVNFNDFFSHEKKSTLAAYRTNDKHINFQMRNSFSSVRDYTNFRYSQNGNGVDMDKEQTNLATNQIYYNALVDRINGKFNTLQSVIRGGR